MLLNNRIKITLACTLIIALLTPYVAISMTKPAITKMPRMLTMLPANDYKAGEVLVQYKTSASSKDKKLANNEAGVEKTLKKIDLKNKPDIELLGLEEGVSTVEAIEELEENKSVAFAEPNYKVKPLFTPNDTNLAYQWGFNNTGLTIQGSAGTTDADIDAIEAWEIEKGDSSAVTVAVIDSGIDTSHPDLSSKLWQNADEIAGNGLDDDTNGYTDDVNGYNWAGISQYYANAFESFADTNTYEFAQSIKGTGQILSSIGISLSKIGSPSGAVTVYVRSTLDGANLANLTINPSDVPSYPSYDEIYKSLNAPITLTEGNTYYIVVAPSSANASNYYLNVVNTDQVADYLTDPYKDGFEHWNTAGGWDNTTYATADIYFRTNPNSFPKDNNGHGTHVSGIIGAATNNSQGVAGTSHGAKIMALKAGDASGSLYTSDIVSAINYAANNGADVINMSFGSSSSSISTQNAINAAYSAGVTLLAAAGNDSNSTINYPGGSTNVIGVGATTNQDTRASFSNYNSTVDITAPGRSIYSTMPTYSVGLNSFGYGLNYSYMSGTSMATPMAAGVAALIISKNPSYTPSQVQDLLQNYSQDLGSAGRDNYFGYGRINAYGALTGTPASVDNSTPEPEPETAPEAAPDTTAPATPTVSSTTHANSTKYYSNNDPYFTFSSSEASNYNYVLDKSSSTIPSSTAIGAATTKSYNDTANGTWYFHVKAADQSGNWSTTTNFKINIDTYEPRTSAPRKAKVAKGKRVKLYYKVTDPYTGNKAKVVLKIKKGKKIIKTINLGTKSINSLVYYLLTATLASGKYKFYVFATDQAGNKQYNIASNYLIIN